MNQYWKKLAGGEGLTQEEWNAQLKIAHESAPGMSPLAFADCRNTNGLSSYQWLVEELPAAESPTILDLACGEGSLATVILEKSPKASIVGLDMSESELELAKKKGFGAQVKFVQGRSQEMPFQDETFNAVLCHMALMLMVPIEPTISEIERVLKPGGIFSAVLSDPSNSAGTFLQTQKIAGALLAEEFPNMAKPEFGDVRTSSEEGLRDLLSSLGKQVSVSEAQFGASVSFSNYWERIENMYLVGMLPEDSKLRLRERLEAELGQGPIEFAFAMRKFTVTI